MSFGRYLKAIREKRGISLEALAEELCLTPRQIVWIEAEDFDRMPADVYTKGILRAYAEALGLDKEDVLERYYIDRKARDEALGLEHKGLGPPWKNMLRMGIALGVMAAVAAATLYGASLLEKERHSSNASSAESKNGVKGTPQPSSDTGAGNAETAGFQAKGWIEDPDSEIQVLSIDAVSGTTLTIVVDGRQEDEYRLAPKDHLELAGRRSFRISISDPAAVRINLNGEPVDIAAEPGKPADLIISEQSESRE
ncbi:MAG: helix-turn-helix domain-containing protein [Thermodesulfobacteriota bacterium]